MTSLDLDFRVTGRGGVPRGSFLLSAPSSRVTTLGSSLRCVPTKPSLRMNVFWSQVSRFSVGMSSQRGPGILDLSLMTISLFPGSLFMLKRFTRLRGTCQSTESVREGAADGFLRERCPCGVCL